MTASRPGRTRIKVCGITRLADAVAAVAAGVDGLFMEVHPNPARALCDGPNSMPLERVESLVRELLAIHRLVRREGESHDGH